MRRGPLYQSDYKPLFSGHETFPMRYGWLKKAYDAVAEDQSGSGNKRIFRDDDSIARFGVGKNMVASMRHWAICAGILAEDPETGQFSPTNIGNFLFGPNGIDPFLEHPTSLWLIHWLLCSSDHKRPLKTTWFWIFNHFNGVNFRRDNLVDGLMKLADSLNWKRVSEITVRRDVECFVRMYEACVSGINGSVEDALESPLSELGLVHGSKNDFHLVRGAKPSLSNGVFTVALNSFWTQFGLAQTLSFEMIAYEPGSPGRVFLLDEVDLAERLLALDELTQGIFRWSETAGLKQVIRTRALDESESLTLLGNDYKPFMTWR